MLIDDMFSLARRVAPRGSDARRAAFVPRPRPATLVRARRVGSAVIRRDLLCLQPTRALDAEVGSVLVDSVLRVLAARDPAPMVTVLTLESTDEIADQACDALVDLNYRLGAGGVRLFVGALTGGVYEKLRASGAVSRIGATSVWQSRQTALLAAYEELAGPAVVTRQVIATLEECVVPLVV